MNASVAPVYGRSRRAQRAAACLLAAIALHWLAAEADSGIPPVSSRAPIVQADEFGVLPETPASVDVFANDRDPDGDVLGMVSFTLPMHGVLQHLGAGRFTYTPPAGVFRGTEQFSYTATDGRGGTNSALVTLHLGPLLAGPWSMFGRTASHSGHYPGRTGSNMFQADWTWRSSNAVHSVAVADGRVFVAASTVRPAEMGVVVALDSGTGRPLWSRVAPARRVSGPACDGNRVFVESSGEAGSSFTGALSCLDADTGTNVWVASLATRSGGTNLAPTPLGNWVWAPGFVGQSGALYGFNSADGLRRFVAGPIAGFDQWTSTYHDGGLYTWVAADFNAFDPATGSLLWTTRVTLGSPSDNRAFNGPATAVMEAGRAYVLGGTRLITMDLATRTPRFLATNGTFGGHPAVLRGIVYAPIQGGVAAHHAATGVELGRFATPTNDPIVGQPIVTDDALIAAGRSSTFVFDRDTLQLRQRIPYGGLLSLADGRLYLANEAEGLVRAYRLNVPAPPDDVGILATAVPPIVQPGSALTFFVTVTNTGPGAADGLTATLHLPSRGTPGTINGPGTWQSAAGVLTWQPGNIGPGSSATLRLDYTASTAGDELALYANLATAQPDPNPLNNAGSVLVPVRVPTLALSDVEVIEGDSNSVAAVFNVSLLPATTNRVEVAFSVLPGSALGSFDYVSTSGSVVFEPGETNRMIPVEVLGDRLNEAVETFTVQLAGATNAAVGDAIGLGTILDQDPEPELSVSDVTLPEGDAGTNVAVFLLTLSAPSGRSLAVASLTGGGTATPDIDYLPVASMTMMPPGRTSEVVRVSVRGDTLNELNETFRLTIIQAPFVNIVKAVGTATILNDDLLPSIVGVQSQILTESCDAPNSALDPGELVTVAFTLQNIGTGLGLGPATATLLLTGGVVWASAPQPIAALPVGGAVVIPRFSLMATGNCGSSVLAWLRLEDAVSPGIEVAFPLRLGFQRVPGFYECCNVDDLRLVVTDDPDPLVVGTEVTYSVRVTNAGPVSASGVVVSNVLPVGVTFVSAVANTGTVVPGNRVVTANVGTLLSGGTATLTIRGRVEVAGLRTNLTMLFRAEPDGNLANNVALTVTRAVPPIVIIEQPQPVAVMRGETARFSVLATAGSPVRYQWRWFGTNLPGATQRTLVLTGVQLSQQGPYDVVVQDDDFSRVSATAPLTVNELFSVAGGFVNIRVAPGYSMILNPLVGPTNTVAGVLPLVPEGSSLFKLDGNGFLANNYLGGWSDPEMSLIPGEACFFKNPLAEAVTLTFLGLVPGGRLTARLPAGFSAASSIVPQAGLLQDLGFPAEPDDVIHFWDNASANYRAYSFDGSFWFPDAPRLEVGQSFWVRKATGTDWVRFFTVNPFNLPDASFTVILPPIVSEVAQVNFSTYGAGLVLDFDEATPVDGRHLGQLYAGSTGAEENLTPIGKAVPFLEGPFAGYIRDEAVRLPGLRGGDGIFLQLRVWESAGGASYEAAVAAGKARGRSAVFARTAGSTLQAGGPGQPPPDANGFPSFHLVSPPRIVIEPTNQTVFLGADLQLSVGAVGTGPLTYQWQFQGVQLAGQTNSTLVLVRASPALAGNYRVIVTNPLGVAFSANARVEVVTPSLAVNDARTVESDAGDTSLSFEVRLTPPSTVPVSVRYATTNVTGFDAAVPGVDYRPVSGLLVVPPGTASVFIPVPVLGDLRDEVDERFMITVAQVTNAAITRSTATGVIVDNDPEPLVNITAPTVAEGNWGFTVLPFQVTLSEPSGRSVILGYTSVVATASVPLDFVATNGQLVLRPGELNGTIRVLVRGDTSPEPDETLELRLGPVFGGALLSSNIVGTILNDDSPPDLGVFDVRLDDSAMGDHDGAPDPGETLDLWLTLINTGSNALTGLTGRLASATPGVTLLVGESAYPDLGAGIPGGNSTPYRLRIEPSVPCGAQLEFVHRTDHNAGSSTNQFSLVVTNARFWTGTSVPEASRDAASLGLAFDSTGLAHVAYYDVTSQRLRHGTWDGQEWRMETVETYVANGFEVSLALNAAGQPRLCYRVDGANSLRYAERTGTGWRISVFGGAYGVRPCLAVDANDQPHIGFFNMSPRGMRYARRVGTSWEIQTPDATGEHTGYLQAIATDRQGRPRIAYHRDLTLFYAEWNGSVWTTTLVDSSIALNERPSLVLDAQDQPHIVCKSSLATGFHYARRTEQGWVVELVGTSLDAGYGPTLALDAQGRRHVSHSTPSAGLLRYSRWEDGVWTHQTVNNQLRQSFAEQVLAWNPVERSPMILYQAAPITATYVPGVRLAWSAGCAESAPTTPEILASTRVGSQIRIEFTTIPGYWYRLLRTGRLGEEPWVPFGASVPATGDSLTLTARVGGTDQVAYFRIEAGR